MTHAGATEVFVRRGVCCHAHRLDDGEYCTSCPHLDAAERRGRLVDWMAGQTN